MIKGLTIRAKAARRAEILIYEDIGAGFWSEGVTAKSFLKELRALGDLDTIDVRINSNGGSVFDGLAIYNGLRAHSAHKTVHIDGIAASIASVIAMAGNTISMGEGSFLMIHSPYTMSMGNADDMRETADLLDQIEQQLIDIYSRRTQMDGAVIREMLAAETWMDAARAVELGFADDVVAPIKMAAHAAPHWKNAPALLAASPRQSPHIAPPGAVLRSNTMSTQEELRARAGELQQNAAAIREKAATEKRGMTPEEITILTDYLDQFDQVEAEILAQARLERAESAMAQPMGKSAAEPGAQVSATPSVPGRIVVIDREPGKWGWKTFGEFCSAVRGVEQHHKVDPRLVSNAALSTYGNEGAGADGGFVVPPEWRSQIMSAVAGEDSLLSRTDQQQSSGNTITFPADETTAWQSTGGILAYWDSEASTMTQSKPSLKEVTIKLNRVTALVPVTDELLDDAAAMGGYVSRKAAEKIAFKVNDAIINGTGVGQPLGIMGAAATVSVAKVTSQVAATFHADNAVAMMARMPAQSYGRSVWLINQDVVPQVLKLGFVVTTAAGAAGGAGALYLPPNGLANTSAYGSLLGRPIVVTEACATLGTVGDVILADLSQYLTVVKSGGVRSDTSIHLWFDQNATAFRFVLRVAGQPWLSAPIARKSGNNTLSHFITLATRS